MLVAETLENAYERRGNAPSHAWGCRNAHCRCSLFGWERLFNGSDHGGAAKKAKDGMSGTLVKCDGLPNIVRRRRRNFWDGTRCQSGQSWIQRQKPAARLLFVLRRDMLRVKTACNGEDGKNQQWFASRQTSIRYDQQESAMIRK